MASKKLNAEQAEKQKAALSKFHNNPDKATSAGSIKGSRALGNVNRKIADLTDPSAEIIRKALIGGLVPEMEVWKGTELDKAAVLDTDKSARFEFVEIDAGLTLEVLIKYVPVSKNRIALAQWLISQDIALKKAVEDSKLRKIETAMKQKKAEDEGALKKEDPVEKARQLAAQGNHVRPVFSMDIDEEDSSEDE
jgi:hypothetical protein